MAFDEDDNCGNKEEGRSSRRGIGGCRARRALHSSVPLVMRMLDLLPEKTEQVGEKGTRPDGEGGREAADVEREKPLGVGGRIKKLTHRFHEWILKKIPWVVH